MTFTFPDSSGEATKTYRMLGIIVSKAWEPMCSLISQSGRMERPTSMQMIGQHSSTLASLVIEAIGARDLARGACFNAFVGESSELGKYLADVVHIAAVRNIEVAIDEHMALPIEYFAKLGKAFKDCSCLNIDNLVETSERLEEVKAKAHIVVTSKEAKTFKRAFKDFDSIKNAAGDAVARLEKSRVNGIIADVNNMPSVKKSLDAASSSAYTDAASLYGKLAVVQMAFRDLKDVSSSGGNTVKENRADLLSTSKKVCRQTWH